MKEKERLDYLSLPSSLYEKIERDITDLFIQQNIRTYPVDPNSIAQQLGYELISFNKMDKEAKRMLVSKDMDGFSYFDPKKRKFIIYYRPDRIKERLRFTIGHEIGHIRMGHKEESELARRIADYYAAYLLAPSPWIGHAECEDFADVAKTFGISNSCAMRCFARFGRWSKVLLERKDYENKLLLLVSKKEVMKIDCTIKK